MLWVVYHGSRAAWGTAPPRFSRGAPVHLVISDEACEARPFGQSRPPPEARPRRTATRLARHRVAREVYLAEPRSGGSVSSPALPGGHRCFEPLPFLTTSTGEGASTGVEPGTTDFAAMSISIFDACCFSNWTDAPPVFENCSRSGLALA